MNLAAWHRRFQQQVGWNRSIISYLLKYTNLNPQDSCALEIGCGTGAVLEILNDFQWKRLIGVDWDYASCAFIKNGSSICADANQLPVQSQSVDLILCHYFLLWCSSPGLILQEALRILRPGGWFIAAAEPDHASRIDFPSSLEEVGKAQTAALQRQGVNPYMGRQLRGILHQSGLLHIKAGITGGEWQSESRVETEWDTLLTDCSDKFSPDEWEYFKTIDQEAWENEERILFIPTFFACGQKQYP